MAVLLLTGCVTRTGDFGRLEPNRVGSLAFQSIGTEPTKPAQASQFELTDNEIELRARAFRFFMPAHRQGFFTRGRRVVVHAWQWPTSGFEVDITAYYRTLQNAGYMSVAARYNAMEQSIRADRALIEPFMVMVRAVYRDDRRRLAALSEVGSVSEAEVQNAMARIAENRRVAFWAHTALEWRAAAYGYALDRTRIELPSDHDVRVETALVELVAAIEVFGKTLRLLDGEIVFSETGAGIVGGPVEIGPSGTGQVRKR